MALLGLSWPALRLAFSTFFSSDSSLVFSLLHEPSYIFITYYQLKTVFYT